MSLIIFRAPKTVGIIGKYLYDTQFEIRHVFDREKLLRGIISIFLIKRGIAVANHPEDDINTFYKTHVGPLERAIFEDMSYVFEDNKNVLAFVFDGDETHYKYLCTLSSYSPVQNWYTTEVSAFSDTIFITVGLPF